MGRDGAGGEQPVVSGRERETSRIMQGFYIQAVSGQRKNTTMKAGDNLILQIRMKEKGAYKLGLSMCLTF